MSVVACQGRGHFKLLQTTDCSIRKTNYVSGVGSPGLLIGGPTYAYAAGPQYVGQPDRHRDSKRTIGEICSIPVGHRWARICSCGKFG